MRSPVCDGGRGTSDTHLTATRPVVTSTARPSASRSRDLPPGFRPIARGDFRLISSPRTGLRIPPGYRRSASYGVGRRCVRRIEGGAGHLRLGHPSKSIVVLPLGTFFGIRAHRLSGLARLSSSPSRTNDTSASNSLALNSIDSFRSGSTRLRTGLIGPRRYVM
jgi:hypothetical protein